MPKSRIPRALQRWIFLLCITCFAAAATQQEPLPKLTLAQAIQVLNSSPWARQETYTKVISGIGSGVSGEKEIFNTFYVRIISALPVRGALARLQQIQYGYDGLPKEAQLRFDGYAASELLSGFGDWIVVAVSFRSNDPNEESNVRRFFQKQTAETLKNKAFLSTEQFSQVRIRAYFAPRDEGIGAKFVFPRQIDGVPIVSQMSKSMAFELLDVPAASPRLRASFAANQMVVNGQLLF
jgi:hypothetical protein